MSGPRRLAVFLSGVWMLFCAFLSATDPVFNTMFFGAVGIAPVALVWGLWWVVAGFRQKRT